MMDTRMEMIKHTLFQKAQGVEILHMDDQYVEPASA